MDFFFYSTFGLILASEIELPELEAYRSAPSSRPDLRIVRGNVPKPDPSDTGIPWLHRHGEAALFVFGPFVSFLVSDGTHVIVEEGPEFEPSVTRLFLLGSVLGMVCHQRSMLPLHASAVAVDGQAIAFTGRQGAGKSTIAAHCVAAGGKLVADDVLIVSFDNDGRPIAHPGMPSVKLWSNALQSLGRSSEGLRPDWWRADKYHFPVLKQTGSVPLNRLLVLDVDEGSQCGATTTLKGHEAAAALVANTYRVEFLDVARNRVDHFCNCARLAQVIEVSRLSRRWDPAMLPQTAAELIAEERRTRHGRYT